MPRTTVAAATTVVVVDPDDVRRLLVARNLVAPAFACLTEAFLNLPFEALGPTKGLLKRYLSSGPWGAADDQALAATVGPGEGRWTRRLDDDLTLDFGWDDAGAFYVAARAVGHVAVRAAAPGPLDASFDGPVVPEATPNPRTIRFGFGHAVQDGPSRWYESPAAAKDDPAVAGLFAAFDRVANVLVGPDFVAVGLRRPGDWEELLAPVLAAVGERFASGAGQGDGGRPAGGPQRSPWAAEAQAASGGGERHRTRLEQAWTDLGVLRPGDPQDEAQVVAAAADQDHARRQVAASLLREAVPATAEREWGRLAGDPVRDVRRAVVDAMVDVGRPELRPILESALGDDDAWVRWKALRGLAELGAAPSRGAIEARAADPDFRVRLEAAAALRAG